jgi:hypothetical protein
MTQRASVFAVAALGAVLVVAILVLPDPDLCPNAAATRDAEATAVRVTAKLELGRDVAAGCRTLTDAAAVVAALNRRPPEPKSAAAAELALTREERPYREVINWVVVALAENPAEREAALDRLEAEFRQVRPGEEPLPEPDPAAVEALLARARERLDTVERRSHGP